MIRCYISPETLSVSICSSSLTRIFLFILRRINRWKGRYGCLVLERPTMLSLGEYSHEETSFMLCFTSRGAEHMADIFPLMLCPDGTLLLSAGWFWLCKENRIWKENMDFLWNPGVRSPRDHPEQRSWHFGRLLVTGNLNVWTPDWQVWASGPAPLLKIDPNISAVVTLIRRGTGSELACAVAAQHCAAEPNN